MINVQFFFTLMGIDLYYAAKPPKNTQKQEIQQGKA